MVGVLVQWWNLTYLTCVQWNVVSEDSIHFSFYSVMEM